MTAPEAPRRDQILIVEDHEEMRKILVNIVQAILKEHEVLSVTNFQDALAMIQERADRIFLLFSDNRMPKDTDARRTDAHGLEIVQRAKLADVPHVAFVSSAITASGDETNTLQRTLRNWGVVTIRKDDGEGLRAYLRSIIGREDPLTEEQPRIDIRATEFAKKAHAQPDEQEPFWKWSLSEMLDFLTSWLLRVL